MGLANSVFVWTIESVKTLTKLWLNRLFPWNNALIVVQENQENHKDKARSGIYQELFFLLLFSFKLFLLLHDNDIQGPEKK